MGKKFLNGLAYFALIIIGLLMLINGVLPRIGIEISGPAIGVLELIKNLFVLLTIGIVAYNYTLGKAKWVKVLYWIAVIIFIAANIFNFI